MDATLCKSCLWDRRREGHPMVEAPRTPHPVTVVSVVAARWRVGRSGVRLHAALTHMVGRLEVGVVLQWVGS